MKRLRHLLWVLLGVVASITLWACEEEVNNNSPHIFRFCVEDESGNDILTKILNCEVPEDQKTIVEGRCSILALGQMHDDVNIIVSKYSDTHMFAKVDPLW